MNATNVDNIDNDVRIYLQELDVLEQALRTAALHLDTLANDRPTVFTEHANQSMKWYKQIVTGIAQIKESSRQISVTRDKPFGKIPLPVLRVSAKANGFVTKDGPESWEKFPIVDANVNVNANDYK